MPVLIVLFLYFLHWIRKTRWHILAKHYQVEKSQYENVHFKYGNANIGGKFRWNAVFSAIEKDGVYLRKPYPFSIFMTAIFIPWQDVKQVVIVDDLESRERAKSRIVGKINPFKYADIHLNKIQSVPVAIIWKESYKKCIPEGILG